MATTDRDIFRVLPLEIGQRCIAEACEGNQYMTSLLIFTMVSRNWCRILMETPTLWATIHVKDADEDSMATIALFLHLAREVQLSLSIWVPLSEGWDTISSMLLPRRDRIRKITLQTDSESHSTECRFKIDISAATILHSLQQVFKTLDLPTSVEYLDVISDRPIRMDSTWVPPNLVSAGNWQIPSRIFESDSILFPNLRYLSMSAIDLVALFPHLSLLGRLQHLCLHSEEQDYINPPPPAANDTAPLHIPFLNTLQYHGRLYWASIQLLRAAARTIKNLHLQIGVLDVNVAINTLAASKFLRRFSLTLLRLEYDLDGSNKRRFYLPRNIENMTSRNKTPKWRLEQLEDFTCEIKSLRSSQVSGNVDLDHLWHFFHTVFPGLRVLVWHLPIQTNGLLRSLIRQKQLRYFESNIVLAPSSHQLRGFVLPSLESLHIEDALMFRGIVIPDLLHFSTTCRGDVLGSAGFTFTQLHSLDLKVSEGVDLHDMSNGDFPLLKLLSLTFLGPRGDFPLLDLPSLTEITISTKSPTFNQGMKFCASLLYEPWKCPRLEQINLNSFLEWSFIYLLLRARNFLQHPSVSRIKNLRLPLLPSIFRPTFVQLLAGRHISSLPFFWSLMTQLSFQGAQSRLLDHHIIGCFSCVYWGLGDCSEPLQASRWPNEYHTSRDEDRVLRDIIEPLGLFPLYSWDMTRLWIPTSSMYENIWILGHQNRAERWRNEAHKWSKLHHRTLTCHKWCCNPKAMVTGHDMEGDESGSMPSPALLELAEHAEFRDAFGAVIRSLIELFQYQDRRNRSAAAASALFKLVEHAEFRDEVHAVIPSLVKLLNDSDSDVQSTVAFVLAKLGGLTEFRNAIHAVIPSLAEMLRHRDYYVRSTVISTLIQLAEHAEFRNAIHPIIPSLVEMLKHRDYYVRSTFASALAKMAEHSEFRNAIHPIIPSLVEMLKHRDYYVRSSSASALAKLAEHSEFRNEIHPAIFIELLNDSDFNVKSTAASALGLPFD